MRDRLILNFINDINITSLVPAPSPAVLKSPRNFTLAAAKEAAMLQEQGPNAIGLVRMLCKPIAARAAPTAFNWPEMNSNPADCCNNWAIKRAGWITFGVFWGVAAIYLLWYLLSSCWSRNARVVPGS